jgi:hypothetical protein
MKLCSAGLLTGCTGGVHAARKRAPIGTTTLKRLKAESCF